ncbi:MAG: 4Fe-4S binding protein [Dehalococcoidales bacterium]|nr:MAG: 4Fe-4S binding protein [Dehalococcoidales bacterium]
MTVKVNRSIVKIDEDKCNGCGLCVPSCAEGALQIIDGKAKLISEIYCDGLGACLGECPQGAITIEERTAEEYDEEATKVHIEEMKQEEELACGCASANVAQFVETDNKEIPADEVLPRISQLGHWPVQLTLVPPNAPFFQDANLVIASDCVPFAYPGFHHDFLKDRALVVACPKLDDFQAHLAKLTSILKQSSIKSLKVIHMEVPCCSGLVHMAKQAIQQSGKDIPMEEVTIGIKGEILATA